jgi:hypothetical protein
MTIQSLIQSMNSKQLVGVAAATFIVAGSVSANASNLWIDDVNGNIGLVDTATGTIVPGTLHNTGQILTDIGFIGTQMYGTVCRQSISDSWLGNLRECLAHLV